MFQWCRYWGQNKFVWSPLRSILGQIYRPPLLGGRDIILHQKCNFHRHFFPNKQWHLYVSFPFLGYLPFECCVHPANWIRPIIKLIINLCVLIGGNLLLVPEVQIASSDLTSPFPLLLQWIDHCAVKFKIALQAEITPILVMQEITHHRHQESILMWWWSLQFTWWLSFKRLQG